MGEHAEKNGTKIGRPWLRAVLWSAGIAIGMTMLIVSGALILLLRVAPAPVVHTNPAIAQKLARELQRAQAAAAIGESGVVNADEAEINSTLEHYLRAAPATTGTNQAKVQDMKLNLVGDRLRLYVLLNVKNKNLSVLLQGKLTTANGYLNFEPESGKIGDLPIPGSWLRKTMNQLMENPESRKALQLPSNLNDVHVESGKMVVTYR